MATSDAAFERRIADQRRGLRIARRAATVAAVLAVLGTIAMLLLVERLSDTYQNGLEVATDAGEVASESAQVAIQIAGDVNELVDTATTSVEQIETLLVTTADSTSAIGGAMSTNLAQGMDGVSNIANGLAGLIETIERFIPGDSQSLAEDLRALALGLEPVPDQLRGLGTQLQQVATQLTAAVPETEAAAAQLASLSTSLTEAQATLAEIGRLADDLAQRAEDALDRAEADFWLVRLIVLLLGAAVVVLCFAGRHALRVLESSLEMVTAPAG